MEMEIPFSSSRWVSSSSKVKKDTKGEERMEIRLWSITPESEEENLSVSIQSVQCLQKVPAAHH